MPGSIVVRPERKMDHAVTVFPPVGSPLIAAAAVAESQGQTLSSAGRAAGGGGVGSASAGRTSTGRPVSRSERRGKSENSGMSSGESGTELENAPRGSNMHRSVSESVVSRLMMEMTGDESEEGSAGEGGVEEIERKREVGEATAGRRWRRRRGSSSTPTTESQGRAARQSSAVQCSARSTCFHG